MDIVLSSDLMRYFHFLQLRDTTCRCFCQKATEFDQTSKFQFWLGGKVSETRNVLLNIVLIEYEQHGIAEAEMG